MTQQPVVDIPVVDQERPFEETVVRIFRCTKVVKGGRRFSVSLDDHLQHKMVYRRSSNGPPSVDDLEVVQESRT